MSQNSNENLNILNELLQSAEKSLKSARNIIESLAGGEFKPQKDYEEMASNLTQASTDEGTVIEGIFNGEQMIGPDGKVYPVPANYASKSKLIEGDTLKLTIKPDGMFLFKQIGPIPRKHLVGPLYNDDGQYKVLINGKSYNVLLASVTYFKAKTGDHVTLILPESGESVWGAIENVIPSFE